MKPPSNSPAPALTSNLFCAPAGHSEKRRKSAANAPEYFDSAITDLS
jgi:hypothetical protein